MDSPLEGLSDRELEVFQLIGQGKTMKEIGHELHLNRQRTVVSAAGCRHNPIRDLALHHQRRVAKQPSLVCGVEQTKQNWRCDVVGKVADDSNGRVLALKQLRKVDVKEIGLNEPHVRRNTRRKRRGEIAIEFDGDDLARMLRQRGSQRTAARTDLDEGLVACGCDRRYQPRDPGWFEEVLTESLPSPRERSNPGSRIPNPGSRAPGPGCASAPQSSSSTRVSPRQ